MPLHRITGSGESEIEDVYATESANRRLPRYRIPKLSSAAQPIYDLVHDELLLDGNSRQNLATFCTTWSEPEGRQLMAEFDQQEHDRQGRVSADRGDRESLRAHDRRSLARAGRLEDRRLLDHRIERGLHARRPGAQVAMAQAAHRRRQVVRQAEFRLRTGAGVLAQVRALLRRGDSPGSARGRRARAASGGPQEILRREHDRRHPDARRDVHRRLRAGRRVGARRSTTFSAKPASTSRSISTPPAAGSSRRSSSRSWNGISASRGSSRSAPRATNTGWRRLAWAGWSGATRRICPRS